MEESDSGYFYCLASNEFGDDRCWIYLEVTSDPAAVTGEGEESSKTDNQEPAQEAGEETTTTNSPILNSNQAPLVRINGNIQRQTYEYLEIIKKIGK